MDYQKHVRNPQDLYFVVDVFNYVVILNSVVTSMLYNSERNYLVIIIRRVEPKSDNTIEDDNIIEDLNNRIQISRNSDIFNLDS